MPASASRRKPTIWASVNRFFIVRSLSLGQTLNRNAPQNRGDVSEAGIHINLIFDVDKSTDHVHQFLNRIEIHEKDGKPNVATERSVGAVADELAKYDPDALIVLAHCHSAKGVTGDMKGEVRKQIFQPRRLNILGAEANESDFLSGDKKSKHKRVVDIFDGTDPNYYNRCLGVFQSSDAHSLTKIGSSYTYFKVDDHVTLEDLRQCLIDRDTRIRQSFEYASSQYPRIDSISVSSGFLAGESVNFHPGLNSLLGAKGSGKSLVVEVLRFALGQESTVLGVKDDHDSKLEKCLKLYGEVLVILTDESGKEYAITRTYNPSLKSPTSIMDIGDGSERSFAIAEVFPVLFLSQNEIVRIAEDATGAYLRLFIDRFFDFYTYQHAIERATKDLVAVDARVADALKAHLSVLDAQRKIATCKEEVAKIDRQLTNAVFTKYALQEAIGRALSAQADFLGALRGSIEEVALTHQEWEAPTTGEATIDDEPSVQRARAVTTRALASVADTFKNLDDVLKAEGEAIETERRDWATSFKALSADYQRTVTETGGTQLALNQKRQRLVAELGTLGQELARHKVKAQELRQLTETRNTLLDKLDAAYKEFFDQRSQRCQYFTERSNGALQVAITEGGDTSAFQRQLRAVKRGSWLKDDDVNRIAQNVTPRAFVGALLRFEHSQKKDRTVLQTVATTSGVGEEIIIHLAEYLLGELPYKDILGLLYSAVPQDVPSIAYAVGGEYKPLSELSVGQKAVALLIVALSDGTFPIVIDQPEDSLDLRTIWDDVCRTVRGAKDGRQFIITTHNSSVAVASDTDKFTILEAQATRSKVMYSGSLNSKEVKAEVIKYLEGGPETYRAKQRKYHIDRLVD
jgi:energy-coupling factor transporter ATP-binding protein EcfA2